MRSSLVTASVFTLVALFGLLFGFVIGLGYLIGYVSIIAAVTLVVIVQLLLFLVSPFLMDIMLHWLYKAKKYDVEAFSSVDPAMAETIRNVSEKYGFKPPKLYLIPDEHPTAFCYGINRSHARIAVSKGILTYLDPEERKAVVAHELGHIVHRDFIVMTVASIIVQILYIIAEGFLRSGRSSDNKKGSGAAVLVGVVAYVLYWIANLMLLWLSRIREYYADEFAANIVSPQAIASALVKVAYGITTAPGEAQLVKRVGALGIMDTKTAKQGLLLNRYIEKHPDVFEKMLAYDLYSPWARLAELTSTHPLTGKRIARLLKMADPSFEVRRPDMERMYARFLADLSVWVAPVILPLMGCVAAVLTGIGAKGIIGSTIAALGLAILLRTFYAFPAGEAERKTVLDLMCDPYASPLRGKHVELAGKVVGRGVPGYVLSEDFVVDDGTGIVYVDFRALIPGIGELFFAMKEIKRIMGHEGRFRGWFFRGITGTVVLGYGEVGEERIHSHPRAPGLLGGGLALLLGVLLLAL